MTEELKILIVLFALAVGEGKLFRKNDRPYQGKEEPWNCDDNDDCRENKALLAAGKLSATDVQQEVTDISRQLEKVLDRHSGLQLETLFTEGDDEIVIKAKVILRADNDIFDVSDDEDFIDYDEVLDQEGYHGLHDEEIWDDDRDDGEIYDLNDIYGQISDDDDDDDDDDNDDDDDDDDDGDGDDDDDNEDEDDDDNDNVGIDMMLLIVSDGLNDEIDN